MPSEARYCLRCGRPVDDSAVPVFDLNPPEPLTRPPDGPNDRPTATIVGVALAVVAVLIGLSIFSDDRSDGDDDASSSTTSTTLRPSTTRPNPARPPTTESTLDDEVLIEPNALLDPAWGLAIVWFHRGGEVVVADLGTGAQLTTRQEALASVEMVSWNEGTFIASGANGWVRRLTVDGASWEDLDGIYPHWGGVPGMFWVTTTDQPTLAVLKADGTITEAPIPESVDLNSLNVVGHIDGQLLVSTADGVFAIGPDRTIGRAGYGTVLGVGGRYVVRRVCDDQFKCSVVRDELEDGAFDPARQVVVETDSAAADQPFRAYPSPDGRVVVLLSAGMSTELRVVSIESGETSVITAPAMDDPYGLRWVGGGQALVWWNGSDRTVHVLSVDGVLGRVPVNPRAARSGAAILVVPMADLPPAWVPTAD